MKNSITIVFVLFTFLFLLSLKANADCQSIYGGGQTCTDNSPITLSETVLNPQTNQLVPNLGATDPKYRPGDIITFQIKAINNGSNTISSFTIKDILPQDILFSDGPGKFDKNTNTLIIEGRNLTAGQTATYTIIGRIQNNANSGCINNQTSITSDNIATAYATSQFCIEGQQQSLLGAGIQKNRSPSITSPKILPIQQQSRVTENPPTGLPTEMLIGLLAAGILGSMLRIYSNKIYR